MANFSFETHIERLLKKSQAIIAGCDEVGRGCLAGPVVACCLTFKASAPASLLSQVTDSKKLSKVKREKISLEIKKHALFAIAEVDVATIDKINILQASLLAMQQASNTLQKTLKIDALIIDGNQSFNSNLPSYTLIKADNISLNVAGASILAKVYRDQLMANFTQPNYQVYQWYKNAGYGTAVHLSAIKNYGITNLHRQSFAPIKNWINKKST